MKIIISILLAVVLLLTASEPFAPVRELLRPADRAVMADALPTGAAEPSPAPTVSTAGQEGADWADMDYRHYDPAWFYAQTDRLAALGAQDDVRAVLELYDTLYAELARIDTLGAIAYIRYCADVTDAYWSQESVYCSKLLAEAADALSLACRGVTEGPCAEAFAAHVGDGAAEALADYVPMTDREAELTGREAELVDEYNALINDADAVSYSYLGRTWTWDMLNGFPGVSLADRDYDGYLEVYYGLQKELNDLVAPVFTELVSIRAELAEAEGYESYADLAYERVYGRDYGPEEAQLLCDAAKAVGKEFYGSLDQSPLWYGYGAVGPVPDADGLMRTLGEYAGRIDPTLAESWQYMTCHGLCDVSDGENRFPGSFTVALNAYDSAFIFAHLSGNCADLGSLAHEFGHFAYDRLHPDYDLLTDTPCYDLLEVHSTGLETLLTEYYGEIYADGADTARFLALGELVDAVLEGCIFDEFQRRIYSSPDMTPDEIDRLFADVCAEYGREELRDVDYSWMYVSHTFESPLYYLSYAVSALAAIQIWDLAREDFRSGVDAWKKVMDADAYKAGYSTVLTDCGLRLFTEPGAVEDICRPLLEELYRLDAAA